MAVQKSSVSFDPLNWKRLAHAANKSKVVNDALHLYFMLETMNAEQECAYSEKEIKFLQREWKHYQKTKESYSYEETFNRD